MSGTEPTLEALASENAELKKQLSDINARLATVEQQSSVQRPQARPPRPNGSLTSRTNDRYLQQKGNLVALLRGVLVNDNRAIALMPFTDRNTGKPIPGQWYDPSDLSPIPSRIISAEQLIRAVAAHLTGEDEAQKNLNGARQYREITPHDMTPRIERYEVELAALKLCTDDLVAASRITANDLHPRFTGQPEPQLSPSEAHRRAQGGLGIVTGGVVQPRR